MDTPMKWYMIIMATLCAVNIGIGVYVCQKPALDLPEEIQAISISYTHPDTLTGYQSPDGTIHIQYLPKIHHK